MKPKTVNVRIPKELRNKLKKEAIDKGLTLQKLVEQKLNEEKS